jgi:hypothetical protein
VQALAPDVEELIDLTIKLVDLIYWKPVVDLSIPYHQRAANSMDMGYESSDDSEDTPRLPQSPGPNATLQERKAYGDLLLSRPGRSCLL